METNTEIGDEPNKSLKQKNPIKTLVNTTKQHLKGNNKTRNKGLLSLVLALNNIQASSVWSEKKIQ